MMDMMWRTSYGNLIHKNVEMQEEIERLKSNLKLLQAINKRIGEGIKKEIMDYDEASALLERRD